MHLSNIDSQINYLKPCHVSQLGMLQSVANVEKKISEGINK